MIFLCEADKILVANGLSLNSILPTKEESLHGLACSNVNSAIDSHKYALLLAYAIFHDHQSVKILNLLT